MPLLVPGINPTIEAFNSLSPSVFGRLLVSRKELPPALKRSVSAKKVRISRVTKDELDGLLPGVNHQGLALEISHFPYRDPGETLRLKSLVFLDGLESPVNLGTISRACAFFGVEGLVFPKRRSVDVTPLAIKVSEGAIFHPKVFKVGSPTGFLRELKDAGFFIIGAVERGGEDPFSLELQHGRYVLVLGGEDTGIRPIRMNLCDVLVTIRGSGRVSSLNVSQACSIILSHLFRLV